MVLSGCRFKSLLGSVVLCVSLAACGGGGSGGGSSAPPPLEFSLGTKSLSFDASTRFSGPAFQTVTANVTTTTGGTLYLLVKLSGPAVGSVGSFTITGTTSGSAQVYAPDPATLAPGTYQGTIAVTACMNSADCSTGQLTGSPQTISVTYTVQPPTVQGQIVMPRVTISNTSGDVILRGAGFAGATAVSFGATPAASFTVVSDTEIHATHPMLSAGSYPISISGGTVSFGALLAVIDPQSYTAATLAYPSPALAGMVGPPVYDAVRQTIYVVLKNAQPAMNRLVSYTYSGGVWGNGQQATIADLNGVALDPSGTLLLGYADLSVLAIDPATLAVNATYSLPSNGTATFGDAIDNLSLVNDGYAIVTFACGCASGFTPIFMFSTHDHTFTQYYPDQLMPPPDLPVTSGVATTSGDGSTAIVANRYAYQPSTGTFQFQPFDHNTQQGNVEPPLSMDNKGSRISFSGTYDSKNYNPCCVDIYDNTHLLLGRIFDPAPPNSGLALMWGVVSPNGQRAYGLRFDFSQNAATALFGYDISSPTPVSNFPQVGSMVSLAPAAMNQFRSQLMTITPDGQTVLIAADSGLLVQPIP
jgi:hypothetical protein